MQVPPIHEMLLHYFSLQMRIVRENEGWDAKA